MTFINKVISVFQRDFFLLSINLVTGVIVARKLGVEAVGIWSILLLLPAYSDALIRTKADLAAVFFIGKKRYSDEDILLNLNIIGLGSVVIALGILFYNFEFVYQSLFEGKSQEFKILLQIFSIQIPLQFFFNNYAYFFIGHQRVNIYNRMVLIQAALNLLVLLFLLVSTEFGLWSVVYSSLLGSFVGLLYAVNVTKGMKMKYGKIDICIISDLLKKGFKFYISGFLGHLQQTGTNLLTLSYLTLPQIAFLSQAQALGRLLQKIVDPINLVLYPDITRKNEAEAIEISCSIFRITFVIMFIGSLILATISDLLIKLLYGSSFSPASEILIILIPGFFWAGVSGTLQNFFNGTGRFSAVPLMQVLPVIVQLLFALIFADFWGVIGVAYAISIGLILYGFFLTIFFIRVTRISFLKLVPSFKDFNFLLSKIKYKFSK